MQGIKLLGDCEYVAIFDADFKPEPDFLLRTVPYLVGNSEIGYVQTRWTFTNPEESYLTKVRHIPAPSRVGHPCCRAASPLEIMMSRHSKCGCVMAAASTGQVACHQQSWLTAMALRSVTLCFARTATDWKQRRSHDTRSVAFSLLSHIGADPRAGLTVHCCDARRRRSCR